jgi:hypothetical protein
MATEKMASKTLQARKYRLARSKAERNKRIEGKNRIARNAEQDKRIERLYHANCSGSPMNALDICRVLQAVNRAIALNPEITDAELATVFIDFVQTIRMNRRCSDRLVGHPDNRRRPTICSLRP